MPLTFDIALAVDTLARPLLVVRVTALIGNEVLRVVQHGRAPGLLRRTRLALGVALAMLVLWRGIRHLWPVFGPDDVTVMGAGAFLVCLASLWDLRAERRRPRLSSLSRTGVALGAAGAALMGLMLAGEPRIPWSQWWPPFLIACALLASAGVIYVRVRTAPAPQQPLMLNRADLESIHKYSGQHRDLLARSERAGCFHCGAIFTPTEIMDWVDGRYVDTGSPEDGVTALCPRCGIDAVLPSAAPIRVDDQILSEMHRHWFEK